MKLPQKMVMLSRTMMQKLKYFFAKEGILNNDKKIEYRNETNKINKEEKNRSKVQTYLS